MEKKCWASYYHSTFSKSSNPFYDKHKHARHNKSSRYESPTSSSSGKERCPSKKTSSKGKEYSSFSKGKDTVGQEEKVKQSSIKCFKCLGRGHIASHCPSKKSMILKHGEYEYLNSSSPSPSYSSSSSDNASSDGDTPPLEGDVLVVRRLLGALPKEDDDTQRENIFHTRFMVHNAIFSLIIDSGSCANIASTRLFPKLKLCTSLHPRPYKLQWLNDHDYLVVDMHVLVSLTFGKYSDDILCDVVPMEETIFCWVGLVNLIERPFMMVTLTHMPLI